VAQLSWCNEEYQLVGYGGFAQLAGCCGSVGGKWLSWWDVVAQLVVGMGSVQLVGCSGSVVGM
jgi:hypothetical protein